MKLTKLPKEFAEAAPLLKKIEAAGYEAYFVGGSVRDTILGQPIHDVDIATSAFPAEIKALFPRTIDIGIEHGTVLVLWEQAQYEITTFRTEAAYQDYRRPDKVDFVRSLKEDLKRRDFTINALALQEDGVIIDLFDGLAAIHANHALLGKISVERIMIEFVKLLLGNHRNQALRALVETECYIYCPGLREYGEALLRMADLPAIPLENETAAWVLLIDQMGLAPEAVRSFLKAWKCSNDCIRQVHTAYQALLARRNGEWNDLVLYQFGLEATCLAEGLLRYDNQPNDPAKISQRYQQLPIHSLKELAINGRDLLQTIDRSSGPWLKEVLTAAEAAVITRKIPNEKEALLAFVQAYLAKEG